MDDMVLVTDWAKVEADDFYLSSDWDDDADQKKEAIKLQAEGNLYKAYIVSAKNYCIYAQMDAAQIFIDQNAAIVKVA